MTAELEAVGDIATGALLGRAVEPHAGEAPGSGAAHGLCLNCGTALIGEYCHVCGQNEHVHRTLGSIGHDLLHGVFHFEGKIWRTIPMLVLHPGALTRRYIAGERARFVSPLALFLFMVFLVFAMVHTFSGDFAPMPPAARATAIKNLDTDIAEIKAEIDAAQAKPGSTSASDLATQQSTLTGLYSARNALVRGEAGGTDFTIKKVNSGWAAVDKAAAKAQANPGLMLYKLQTSAYKYSWLMIPISTLFVALLFLWRRQYKMYDHAIFVTYSLAFMIGVVVVLSLLGRIGAPEFIITTIIIAAPPIHMFAQLRGAYQLRKRSALWRTIALLIFAFLALLTFAILLLAKDFAG